MVHIHDIDALPTELPIFPLPGALLLPRGRLPLNIFEPRYLNMTQDALGAGRMIGMIQPKISEPGLVEDGIEVFTTGCAGRVVSFSETDDGRFMITLLGVCRFRIAQEIKARDGYRRVDPDYEPFAGDLEADPTALADRARLVAAVDAFFAAKGIEGDRDAIVKAEDEPLVTALAMLCPLGVEEKQALLESADTADRGLLMTGLLEMAVRVGDQPTQAARH